MTPEGLRVDDSARVPVAWRGRLVGWERVRAFRKGRSFCVLDEDGRLITRRGFMTMLRTGSTKRAFREACAAQERVIREAIEDGSLRVSRSYFWTRGDVINAVFMGMFAAFTLGFFAWGFVPILFTNHGWAVPIWGWAVLVGAVLTFMFVPVWFVVHLTLQIKREHPRWSRVEMTSHGVRAEQRIGPTVTARWDDLVMAHDTPLGVVFGFRDGTEVRVWCDGPMRMVADHFSRRIAAGLDERLAHRALLGTVRAGYIMMLGSLSLPFVLVFAARLQGLPPQPWRVAGATAIAWACSAGFTEYWRWKRRRLADRHASARVSV